MTLFGRSNKTLLKFAIIIALFLTSLTFATMSPTPQKAIAAGEATKFYSFESPQIHPLAITPDGNKLLAVNSPDNRLSVFDISSGSLKLIAEIPVGLEPVSVAARNNNEVWVVNWLSDSISIVDLTTNNVVRTINVGDEPTDILFINQPVEQAYISVAGARQVKIYDPNKLTNSPKVININGKQPRSLSSDASGKRVFVSIFDSGNQTTIVDTASVTKAGGLPAPNPALAPGLPSFPATSLIVKQKGKKWVDETGDSKWTKSVPYTVNDIDLVVIGVSAEPSIQTEVATVGTHIGNTVFDAATGKLFVVNTDSKSVVRFEPKVKGQFVDTRISIIDFDGKKPSIKHANLNPHINYNQPDGSDQERSLSIGLPADIVHTDDGKYFVASTSTNKVGVLNSDGMIQQRITVGEGPTGLAYDKNHSVVYVLNRFEESLSVIDLKTEKESTRVPIGFNPEPNNVRKGRQFLYDGSFSAHGDISCASCHRNAHNDGLAWDLGDPTGKLQPVKSKNFIGAGTLTFNLHPMKGPMITQSLRGIIGTEPLHWRGDRSKLSDFNGAFVSLLGGPRQLTDQEMADFTSFVETLTYPPNPLQNLDRTYPNPSSGPSAARGLQTFTLRTTDRGVFTCNFCHTGNPGTGTNGLLIPGQVLLMPNGIPESQPIKVPQLRGLYERIGRDSSSKKQLASFGFSHDGAVDNLFAFFKTPNFTFSSDDEIRDLVQFVLSFDTGTAPAVGFQVTVDTDNKTSSTVTGSINLLMAQADKKNCELIVKGLYNGSARGFLYVGNGMFQPDRSDEALVPLQMLLQAANKGMELTFTGVPVGTGKRLGIDHNLDGKLDNDQ